jgi:large subunit ribosomal protein L15
MPIARRLPKRGFTPPAPVVYQVVNVGALSRFNAGSTVDPATLRGVGLCRRRLPVKLLAKGTIDRGLTVRVHAFSKAAADAIRAAGGTVEVWSEPRPGATPPENT